jgi:mannosyltransferase OCH1-like enzyme
VAALRALRFAINRLIKLFANVAKGACYLLHLALPHKRFTIPRYRPALVQRKDGRGIPRTVWQTNFTDRVTFPVYLNYKFNRLMSLTHEYRLMTDDDCAEFVRETYPGAISAAYENLRIGASRADFWRVLILIEHGGVYIDIDAHLTWPLDALVARNDRELFILDRSKNLTNFFIASEPGHPLLARVVDKIMENIRAESTNDVFHLTGPGAMISAIANEQINVKSQRYVCDQGNFTNEFFQYVDHPFGKWTRQQKQSTLLFRKDGNLDCR